jgi:predicted amidohydrolase
MRRPLARRPVSRQAVTVRVGYVQFEPVFGRKDANLDKVAGFLDRANADLVVLPELFTTGYTFESREELLALAEEPGGKTFSALCDLSGATGAAIVAGLPERDGDACYNSCFVFSGGAVIGSYRKIHLFDREKGLFTPGNRGFTVVMAGGAQIGLMICFDWIFPECARALALMGAQVICHPANLILPHCPQAMITRCLENRVFAITANRIGTETRAGQAFTFIGSSQVVSPRGEVLVRAGTDELIQVIDIDPALAEIKTVTPANHVLADRRPEFYGKLCESPERPEPTC